MLGDLHGADPEMLADAAFLERAARQAAELAGATVLSVNCHHFGAGLGVAGVVLLAESHLTFHTWPEHGFAALDAFMCGDCRPQLAIEWLSNALRAQSSVVRVIERGTAPTSNKPVAQEHFGNEVA